ncbi:LacI family DNA-binding transcriptional regulator [Paenarthrobacter sp. YIM B13468]|uniref:LacI family DNA-binding transcriptional regulator n=1 Tax=Paenarthrobacter sp. YIM B13468 TaxID=3366295 RepID=UPI00366CE0E2
MPVTLKDIAEEANVTLMTVSNVINGRGKASKATVDKVMAIAARLGYVPNAAARSLAAKSSRMIGCLISGPEDENLLRNPYNAAIVGAIEPALRHRGYHMLLQGIADPSAVPAAFQAWSLDGAIFIGFYDSALDTMAPGLAKPVVAVENYAEHPGITNIRLDDRHGGYLATKHLIDNGHRNIAFVGPPAREHGVISERYEGYRNALAEAGIAADTSRVVPDVYSLEDGRLAGATLRRRCPSVTAAFATSDSIAVGLIQGLTETGTTVPDDVSVVGFDDLDLGTVVTPRLTTVAQDLSAQAATAVETLLARIADPGSMPDDTVLGVNLVERASVRKIGARSHRS